MLTLSWFKPNFSPLMRGKSIKILLLLSAFIMLQSCYTLLYPPETLPQTVSTVVSEQAMASSLGGVGAYGWDPYWEPALPFTSYHHGYGSSYYSPYNYYDYQHPYYAPVYIVGEGADPLPGRQFGRDDKQGGGRDRQRNSVPAGSGSKNSGGVSPVGIGSSTANPIIQDPPVKNPIVIPPAKSKSTIVRDRETVRPIKKNRPVRIEKSQPPKENKEKSGSDNKSSKKRVRTRK